MKGLTKANSEDLILISDVDEIPNLSDLNNLKIKNNIILFKKNFYYYKFNLKLEDIPGLALRHVNTKFLNHHNG